MAAAPMLETFRKSRRVDSLDIVSPEKELGIAAVSGV
jgi:hypothetical protein